MLNSRLFGLKLIIFKDILKLKIAYTKESIIEKI